MRLAPKALLLISIPALLMAGFFVPITSAAADEPAPPEPLVALFPSLVAGPVEGLAELFDKSVRDQMDAATSFRVLLAYPQSSSALLAVQSLELKPEALLSSIDPLIMQALVRTLVADLGARPRLEFTPEGKLESCEVLLFWQDTSRSVQVAPPSTSTSLEGLVASVAGEMVKAVAEAASGLQTGTALVPQPVSQDAAEQADALFKEHEVALAAGNTALAISQLLRAVDLAPDNLRYREALGELYTSLRQNSQAIVQYKALAVAVPDSADYQERLGHLYYANNQFMPSAQAFDAALKLDPTRTGLWVNLGKAYDSLDNEVAALAAYRKAADLKLPNPAIYTRLADASLKVGEVELAMDYFQRAAELAPNDIDLQSRIANLFLTQGTPDQTLDALLRLVAAMPEDAAILSPQAYEAFVTWMRRRIDRELASVRQGLVDLSEQKLSREELFDRTVFEWEGLKRYVSLADKLEPDEARAQQHAHFVYALALAQEALLEYLLYIDTGAPAHLGAASNKASAATIEFRQASG